MLYGMYEQGWLGVGKENVLAGLERAEAAEHDEIAGWSPQTRGKVTSNYLTAARDCGLLEGRQRKALFGRILP